MYGMDPSMLSFVGFGFVVVIGGVVMYLISLFSMKETSFESLLEEQKKKKEKEDKERSMLNKQKRDQYKKKFEQKKKKGGNVGNGKVEKVDSGVSPMHEVQIKETPQAAAGEPARVEPKKTKGKAAKKQEAPAQPKQDSPKPHHPILKPTPEKKQVEKKVEPAQTAKVEPQLKVVPPKKHVETRARTVSFSDEPQIEKPKPEPEQEKSKKKKKKVETEVENAVVSQLRETALSDRDVQNILTLIRQKHGIDVGGGTKIKELQQQLDQTKKQLGQQEGSMKQYVSRCMAAESKIEQLKQDLTLEKTKFSSVEKAMMDQDKSAKQDLGVIQAHHSAEVKQLKDKLARSGDYDELLKTTEKIRAENAIFMNEIQKNAAVVSENNRLSGDLQQAKLKLQETQMRCAELEKKLGEYSHHSDNLQKQNSNSAKLLNQVAMLSEENQTKTDLDQQLSELQQQLAGRDAAIQDVTSQNAGLQGQIKAFEEQIAQLNGQITALTTEGKDKSEAVSQLTQEKEALGKAQEDLETTKAESAQYKDEIEKLKNKNNDLRERNWKAMDALTSLEKSLPNKVAAAKEEAAKQSKELESEAKRILCEAFPDASSDEQEFQAWLSDFASKASSSSQIVQSTESSPEAEEARREANKLRSELEQRMSEVSGLQTKIRSLEESKDIWEAKESDLKQTNQKSEEALSSAQAECSKYKNILNSTEDILSKLQSSVEVEEGVWRKKVDDAHQEATKAQRDAEELRKTIEELKADNSSLQSNLTEAEALRQQLNEKISQVSELETKLASKENEVTNNGSLEQLKTDSIANGYEDEMAKLKERLDKEKTLTKNLGQAATKLQTVLKQTQEQLNEERSKSQDLEDKLANNTNSKGNSHHEAIKSDEGDGTSV